MRRIRLADLVKGIAFLLPVLMASPAFAEKTELIVYSSLEPDQLAPYKQGFEAANPDIEISWVRGSIGAMTARIIAEKDNPHADAIWSGSAASLSLFDSMGLLEPYTPVGIEKLKPLFRSTKDPVSWTGMDAWLAVVCFNTIEAGKKNLAKAQPVMWADLANPIYKGLIEMPDPRSVGTGYQTVYAWIQLMGEQAAWDFMDKLNLNVTSYTLSGSAPCTDAAKGEITVGIGLDLRAAKEVAGGAPIQVILPKDGSPWDMEAMAIVKGSKHVAAARKLADFSVSKTANEMYAKFYGITAYEGLGLSPPGYPPNADASMLKIDLTKMGSERARILEEWGKRYSK